MSSEQRNRGLFVVLEGLDGSGKTTIAWMLVKELEKEGHKVVYTYEPTDSEVVGVVKTRYNELRDAYVDALTFALDRLLHVKSVIKPSLERGYIVISDRYFYSSVAYQSAGGAPMEWVLEVNKWALRPDLAVYLDVDPIIGLKRKSGSHSRFSEFEELDLLFKVREAYLKMVSMGLLVMVNAERPIEEVFTEIYGLVKNALLHRELST